MGIGEVLLDRYNQFFCDSRIGISIKETAREFDLKYKNT